MLLEQRLQWSETTQPLVQLLQVVQVGSSWVIEQDPGQTKFFPHELQPLQSKK